VFAPSLQDIINGLADRLALPVVLEDVNQQLLAYSAHHDVTDRMREETILRRSTSQRVVDLFGRYGLADRGTPFVVPAVPDIGMLARLCIPVRYLDAPLGFAWVLLPDGTVTPEAMAAALDVQEQLSLAMLAESRVRARESDSLLSLISPDPDTRVQGLIDVEARGGFEAPRRLVVVVCSGPAWEDAGIRGSFWTAGWAGEPRYQLRGITAREGIALVSVRADPQPEVGGQLGRALAHVRQQRPEASSSLVLGVGGVAGSPDEAHESYRQARLAARVALRDTGLGPVAWWDALGLYRFMAQLPLRTLADAVDPRIGALVETQVGLVETLECYLQHVGAIAVVAEALHIHRTTLYYRLDRLRERGLDPMRADDRAAAAASLAALRLLGRWPLRPSSDSST
jgi:hypothetical protein